MRNNSFVQIFSTFYYIVIFSRRGIVEFSDRQGVHFCVRDLRESLFLEWTILTWRIFSSSWIPWDERRIQREKARVNRNRKRKDVRSDYGHMKNSFFFWLKKKKKKTVHESCFWIYKCANSIRENILINLVRFAIGALVPNHFIHSYSVNYISEI